MDLGVFDHFPPTPNPTWWSPCGPLKAGESFESSVQVTKSALKSTYTKTSGQGVGLETLAKSSGQFTARSCRPVPFEHASMGETKKVQTKQSSSLDLG